MYQLDYYQQLLLLLVVLQLFYGKGMRGEVFGLMDEINQAAACQSTEIGKISFACMSVFFFWRLSVQHVFISNPTFHIDTNIPLLVFSRTMMSRWRKQIAICPNSVVFGNNGSADIVEPIGGQIQLNSEPLRFEYVPLERTRNSRMIDFHTSMDQTICFVSLSVKLRAVTDGRVKENRKQSQPENIHPLLSIRWSSKVRKEESLFRTTYLLRHQILPTRFHL